jgi:hypothetical protein
MRELALVQRNASEPSMTITSAKSGFTRLMRFCSRWPRFVRSRIPIVSEIGYKAELPIRGWGRSWAARLAKTTESC